MFMSKLFVIYPYCAHPLVGKKTNEGEWKKIFKNYFDYCEKFYNLLHNKKH